MTYFAGRLCPFVIFADPVGQPPSVRHSASNSGPAARWMAPSTPPPPSKLSFAALTMASTSSVVMSATTISSRAEPTLVVRIGCIGHSLQGPQVCAAHCCKAAGGITFLDAASDAFPPPAGESAVTTDKQGSIRRRELLGAIGAGVVTAAAFSDS